MPSARPNSPETSEGLIGAPVVALYLPIVLLPGRVTKIVPERAVSGIAKKTMAVAQRLYEGVDLGEEGPIGLITYMRTDSVRISDDALAEVRDYVRGRFGNDYLPGEPNRATLPFAATTVLTRPSSRSSGSG